jgi:hypothetical protein
MNKAIATNLESGDTKETELPTESIGRVLWGLYEQYRTARTTKEELWTECWASYLGSPKAVEYMRTNVSQIVGNVNDDWRHKISTGKSYEIVETINAYLQGAFFPNRDWFSVVPQTPGIADVVDSVKKYTVNKLKQNNFRTQWELYTRQLLITGFSAIALPWVKTDKPEVYRKPKVTESYNPLGEEVIKTTYEPEEEDEHTYSNAELRVIDVFDLFLDPNEQCVEKANLFRVIRKTKGEVLRCISSGFYPELKHEQVLKGKGGGASLSTNNKRNISEFMGIRYDPNEQVELLEFWGNVEVDGTEYCDVVATILGNNVARFEKNPYWEGRPIVVGTCIPVPNKPYGLGVLEPVLGMLHQLNIITNQRLDSLELAVDSMYVCVNDGVTDPEDIFTAPGKIIQVGDPNSIRPLVKDTSFTVSYNEAALLEQNIDQSVGTGAYIGTQQGRSGERVTAQEIQAVRDAGGNRLSSIHGHIEATQLLPFLKKFLSQARQFVDSDEVVRLSGSSPGVVEYVAVGIEELNNRFTIEVIGADHISDRERTLQKTMDFVQLVGQVPQWAESVDWDALLKLATKQFGFDSEMEQLIIKQAKPEEEQPTVDPNDPVAGALRQAGSMGGQLGQQMLEAKMRLQGANSAAFEQHAAIAGVDTQQAMQAGQMLDQMNIGGV